ncbi:hypothetical protein BDU57DRAFT_436084, partial [Ampelomyces quisqualis]
SRSQFSSMQQSTPSGDIPSASSKDLPRTKLDEWSEIKDPNERRKIQNKLAQRRFRDKAKEQKEESKQEAENQRRAGSAYVSPQPEEIDTNENLSGLPWGGISMKHIVEKRKSKENSSRQGSRENSVYGGVYLPRQHTSTNMNSRLGLRLTDELVRRCPALTYLRNFPYHHHPRLPT